MPIHKLQRKDRKCVKQEVDFVPGNTQSILDLLQNVEQNATHKDTKSTRAVQSSKKNCLSNINETLRLKIQLGFVYDQITSISKTINHETNKFNKVKNTFELYKSSLEQFASQEEERVEKMMEKLSSFENTTSTKQDELVVLQNKVLKKTCSLNEFSKECEIQEKCKDFVMEIIPLLTTQNRELSIDEKLRHKSDGMGACENANIVHAIQTHCIKNIQSNYVTGMLLKLRKYNLAVLRELIGFQHVKDLFVKNRNLLEKYCGVEFNIISECLENVTTLKKAELIAEKDLREKCQQLFEGAIKELFGSDVLFVLNALITDIYDVCFGEVTDKKYCLSMIKEIEVYTKSLLFEFDQMNPDYVKKSRLYYPKLFLE